MRARDLRRLFEILVAGCTAETPITPVDGGADADAIAMDASIPATDAGADVALDSAIVDAGVDAFDPCAKTDWTPPQTDLCADFYRLPCGIPSGIVAPPDASCFFLLKDCAKLCKNPYVLDCRSFADSCDAGEVVVDSDGGLIIECTVCSIGPGRAPDGFVPPPFSRRSVVAAYFERAAHLEAASVFAFEHLVRELRAHGAPKRLIRRVERAAQDERRHARMMGVLARRFGGRPSRPRRTRMEIRSREAMAIENAREGCVNETYAALVAHVQSKRSTDASVRRVMGSIARDEARHASLAWSVTKWAATDVRTVMREAADRLASSVETPRALTSTAGLPTQAMHAALVDALRGALWTA